MASSPELVRPTSALRLFALARLVATIGLQMQSVAIAWAVYDLTHSTLSLGYVGLAQFLPVAILTLPAGHAVDRYDRKRVLVVCYAALGAGALALTLLARAAHPALFGIYAVLVLLGTCRAFSSPAGQALIPSLVEEAQIQQAMAYSASAFQLGTIIGPALGGLLYAAIGPARLFAICAALLWTGAVCFWVIRPRPLQLERKAASWEQAVAGLRFVWRQKIILGSISLDLFAVLLGGAVALLPAYAKDILHAGPWGLGILRSAPALGAVSMAAYLARRPLRGRAGRKMFVSVAIFGIATVVFALSHVLWVSVLALATLGAADMVSVVIRLSVVQLATPPTMRGRVSAVNMLFIGASNELGEFESGATAAWWGLVPAAVAGGVGTVIVVLLWALFFPELRRIDRVEDVVPV